MRTLPHLRDEQQWKPAALDDLLFYGALGVIIGARLGEVLFYQPAYYLAHPLEILAVWHGGMSFHGGFLGVLAGMGYHQYKTQRPWLQITDFIAPLVLLGLGAGRLGNFINGELWGRWPIQHCPGPWFSPVLICCRVTLLPNSMKPCSKAWRCLSCFGFFQSKRASERGFRTIPDRLRKFSLYLRIF